jgi:hypothetical protein
MLQLTGTSALSSSRELFGYPGGCNHLNPQTMEISALEIVAFPAELMVWLWHDQPSGPRHHRT